MLLFAAEIPEQAFWGFFIALAAVVGWGVENWRKRIEINKLGIEAIKLEAEQIVKNQEARAAYDLSCSRCSELAVQVRTAINENNNAALIVAKDAMLDNIFNNLMNKLYAALELESLDNKKSKEDNTRLIDEMLLPELDRIKNWLRVFNLPQILARTNSQAFVPQLRSFRNFRKLARNMPTATKAQYHARIDATVTELCS